MLSKKDIMDLSYSIKVKNYKCFGEEEQGFDKICPINIIVGKNNSGKSSLIDMVEFAVKSNSPETTKLSPNSECFVEIILNKSLFKKVAALQAEVDSDFSDEKFAYNLKQIIEYSESVFETKEIRFEFLGGGNLRFIGKENHYGPFTESFLRVFKSISVGKKLLRINAERDIEPELLLIHGNEVDKNGKGATSLIWKLLSITEFDQNLIKKEFLTALNNIINPEIEFVDIIIKENYVELRQNAKGEIQFEIRNGAWVALSKMGSGIKTIILTLLNLIVIPRITHTKRNNLVFCFEELENNLHPSLLRKLFNYISSYSTKYHSLFFITTHSSIVIDLFYANYNSQIIHIENLDNNSVCRTVTTDLQNRNILRDLAYKPSDLLLANGIIWVEGPSDVVYIELMLDLYRKEFNISTKFSYCIQALSTAVWKYAGFSDFDWSDKSLENRLVSLAKVNHNNVIVIDNDNNYDDKKPSNWENFTHGTGKNKARLIHELMIYSNHLETSLENNSGDSKEGKLLFWINEGTFETYLEYFIRHKGYEFDKYFISGKRKYFEKKNTGKFSSKSKVELAAEIGQFALNQNLSIYDLAPMESTFFNKIHRLAETIKSWN